MSKICVIIPCYNEGSRFPLAYVQDFYQEHEMIYFCLVNDGSQDDTEAILTTLAASRKRIKAISLAQNSGKAEAVRQGMLQSLAWQDFDAIGYFDADMATPLSEVFLLYRELEARGKACTMSFGARIKRLGTEVHRHAYRHYFGRIFSTIASLLLRLPVYDTQCGAKLFRPNIIPSIAEKPFLSPWLFDIEIFARLTAFYGSQKALETHVIEVPLNAWIEKGDSRISPTYLLKVPLELWKIYKKYR